jgi:hypothetical protein
MQKPHICILNDLLEILAQHQANAKVLRSDGRRVAEIAALLTWRGVTRIGSYRCQRPRRKDNPSGGPFD